MYALDIKQSYITITICLEDYEKACEAAKPFVDNGCEAGIRLVKKTEEEA